MNYYITSIIDSLFLIIVSEFSEKLETIIIIANICLQFISLIKMVLMRY